MDRTRTDSLEEWLPVLEAAERLSVSGKALRSRIKRRTIRSRKGNDGRLLVCISGSVDRSIHMVRSKTDPRPDHESTGPQEPTKQTPPSPASVVETVPAEMVAEILKAHQEALTAAEARRVADLAAIRADHRDTVAMLIERIDRAEIIIDQLLAERKPWWRRWFSDSRLR